MGSIGESLKSTREAKGISLEQAEEETKIRKRYLQALEDGEYDVIPGRVYAKGFLRNYANYLGLNQEEIMLEYKLLSMPAKEEYKKVDIEASINKRRSSQRSEKKAYLITVLIAVIAILTLVIYNFVYKNTPKNAGTKTKNHSEQIDTTKSPDHQKPAGNQDSTTGTPGSPPAANQGAPASGQSGGPVNGQGSAGNGGSQTSDGVNVTLNGKDQVCWVRITVDGVIQFEGNINPGDAKTFTGKDKIKLRLGNAGAVEVMANGRSLGVLGPLGQPVTREISNLNLTQSDQELTN